MPVGSGAAANQQPLITNKKHKIEGHTIQHLLNTASNVVLRKTKDSCVLDKDAEDRIPKFHKDELTLGRVLGRGGFCVVHEVTKIKLDPNQKSAGDNAAGTSNAAMIRNSYGGGGSADDEMYDEHRIHNIVQDRDFMASHCLRGKTRDCRYAIKKLQSSTQNDAQTYVNGVVDLAIESRFLSVIRHPNIIKMRAMSTASPYEPWNFFVVLDRLYDTLTVRLQKWKKQSKSAFGALKRLSDRSGKKAVAFWVERLTVAYDLACAMKYLHDLSICYRDIKPDNIGFDVRGDVKIFDFGLAKELSDKDRVEGTAGLYKMTADTGSPRYMSPEVALDKPYNETCDVYSFCILTWQILMMEVPFDGYTMKMFQDKVVKKGHRPMCDEKKWPKSICEMLREGWHIDISKRPHMDAVANCLKDEINANSDEEVDEILDVSRKSEMSLRGGGGVARGRPDSSGTGEFLA